ncbi:hypothetical protein NPIL_174961 [Nephila pilipes]|uniref:Secreted protein n=1 Tax=Nephila pilipes TaxID=299642 RepID=A0A8X6P2D2_NEPPI|nr:hypothetical protein NPIL_174961 [Nephila pilipes]
MFVPPDHTLVVILVVTTVVTTMTQNSTKPLPGNGMICHDVMGHSSVRFAKLIKLMGTKSWKIPCIPTKTRREIPGFTDLKC